MFEFIRSHTRLFQFILVILVFPAFVFFGVQGYSGGGPGSETVAKVGGQTITQNEWDVAHRNQVERARAQSPDVDVKLFDTPEMKQRTLESLVRDRTLLVAADKLHLSPSEEKLARTFLTDPQLAFLRKPDGNLNTDLLAAQGMTPAQFEQRLRQDLAMQQVMSGVAFTAIGPSTSANAALDALMQQREVRIARFEAKTFASKVNPTDADIEAFYKDPKNAASFEAPERATVEYVVLDIDAIKAGIKVSDEDLKKYYEENAKRYVAPEERRASHILVKAEKSASAAERDKAKAKAADLLAQVRKNPGSFAELARKNSDDPGSAAKGGDLDFFGRGAMVKAFEDSAFALKVGDISDVVESDFGFHIIQVTGARGGEKKPFEAVKEEIANEVKGQLAQSKYAEAAETFSNTVYEQSDSLKPAADKLGLSIKTAKDISRTPTQGAEGPLGNPKFLSAVFGTDSVKNKRNTEAVDLGGNQLAAGRVLEYSPARRLALDEVKTLVREKVVAQQAALLAKTEAQARLAAWKGGAPADALEPPIKVSRAQAEALPRELIDAVLKASATTLPAWTTVDFGDLGSAVIRIDKVLPREPGGDPKQLQSQYAQVWGAAESEAYLLALKERLKVRVTGVAKASDSATR